MRSASRGEPDGSTRRAVTQVWHWSAGDLHTPDTWAPAMNIYRTPHRLEVCIDLAGLHRRQVRVEVVGRRLIVHGFRRTPRPPVEVSDSLQVFLLEISHGPFRREIELPGDIDPQRVRSEYRQGMLWVLLDPL